MPIAFHPEYIAPTRSLRVPYEAKGCPDLSDGRGGSGDRPRRMPGRCATAELQGAGYLQHDVCHGIFPREFHERRNDMRDAPCRFAISRHRYEHRHLPR
ncbi:hypothetical protein HN011_009925 [Eciton burchellii]|nr:hypothetical protein HN011_009925 [Eciton burchellii]